MNLQIDRIVTLCETLKLVGVSDSYPALPVLPWNTNNPSRIFWRTCWWPNAISAGPGQPRLWSEWQAFPP